MAAVRAEPQRSGDQGDDGAARRWGPRLFATTAGEPRARRVTDGILLVAALLGLAALGLLEAPQPGFARALSAFFDSLPGFLRSAWQIMVDLLAVVALAMVVGAFLGRRVWLGRDLLLAGATAALVWLLVARVVEGSWPPVWDALRSAEPPPWYPAPRVAIAAAVVITASPHLSRPIRRLGRWVVFLGAASMATLGATSPGGAVASILVATIAAAIVHLVFGSSAGRPALEHVRAALRELGVRVRSLGAAERQPAGLFLVHAEDVDGQQLVVKVYGRDAHDSALVTTLWRTVWFRDAGSPIRLGRLQQVEHEAFATLLAGQAGVLTNPVVIAGSTVDDDALLVMRRVGQPLGDVPADTIDASVVRSMWRAVATLHGAGVAHGQCDERTFILDDGQVGMVDFRGSVVAPTSEQLRADQAQTLVATALTAGEDTALSTATDELGPERLAAVLPFLQLPALTPHQRRQVRERDFDVEALRRRAAGAAGTEAPTLYQLRRISVGSLVRVLLPGIAILALVSAAAGLDWEELWAGIRDATWWLVILGVVLAQLPRLTQAVSTLGASPVPLPLGPVYALQLAVSYINLAIPSTAARVAVNIRFFQRHGVPPGTAVAAGALDGFAGFVVQAFILLTLLVLTPASLELDLDSGTAGGAARLLLLVLLIAAVAVVAVFVVRKWRQWVLGWIRRLSHEALGALRGLHSPRRLAMLIGGNLATELLFAMALGAFTRSLGYPIGLGELLLINVSVSLLSGLIPVPGGIGVTEGGLAFGLIHAGMPEELAFGAVILYRLSSFYLPPVWGFFSLRWLERNNHL